MRITLVSGHYPPNFVSGGTLQPQRLARGFRARGHDVRVFAGYLDSTRKGGEAWDDVDETGLPVHWVVSTPWMDWGDVGNYDNPEIAGHFAAHLRVHPADVVHLHSLQTLGGGLVEVARAAGAKTVVTMHDFWWVCARQFLVDRHHRPCSLVVAAGDCACEDGRERLERRAARLAECLEAADLVLAPSRSAARLLAANGVDPARLQVDENGMDPAPPASRARRERADGAPVVARYTGGSNPMKGADVLLDAAHLLGPTPGLRIVAHGLDDAVERDGRRLDGTCIELRAPYHPDEMDDVLARSDVLLLPSIMRESFSLVTREALLRGVPVITTDTIGPEEVVSDGKNGIVVPAAEPTLLAAALRSVTDRDTLERLSDGAGVPPPVRSLGTQLEELEARYEELTVRPDGQPERWRPGRVLFVVGLDGAPTRYRAHLPAEALALHGVPSLVRHYRDPDIDALAAAADVVVVYRVPATPQILALIGRQRARGALTVFDVDDLIFDPDLAPEIPALSLLPAAEAALWLEGVRRYRTTMEACDAFLAPTPRLVAHAREVVGIESHVVANGVGRALGAASDIALRRSRRPGPPRVGYFSGTTTHDDDWRYIEESVVSVLENRPDVELWLGGHLQPTDEVLARIGDRVRRIPFTPWFELPSILRDLDVNLAPLVPGSRFNDAKSAIKWLEAALVATPTIASPSAPFVEAVGDGRAGWLASTQTAWIDALEDALDDADKRLLIGNRARRDALLHWSPHLQGLRYLESLDAIRGAVAQGRRTPSPSWTPVSNDEPPLAAGTPLDPYPPDLTGSLRWHRRPRTRVPVRALIRHKAARLRSTVKEEGFGATVRGAGRVAARVVARTSAPARRVIARVGRRPRP